jgi:hypothetical protein
MKGFVFLCSKVPLRKRKNKQSKGANNATRTSRVVFPARQFRQDVPLAVGERTRPMVGPSTVGAARFRSLQSDVKVSSTTYHEAKRVYDRILGEKRGGFLGRSQMDKFGQISG